jgi:hypothetical protein
MSTISLDNYLNLSREEKAQYQIVKINKNEPSVIPTIGKESARLESIIKIITSASPFAMIDITDNEYNQLDVGIQNELIVKSRDGVNCYMRRDYMIERNNEKRIKLELYIEQQRPGASLSLEISEYLLLSEDFRKNHIKSEHTKPSRYNGSRTYYYKI